MSEMNVESGGTGFRVQQLTSSASDEQVRAVMALSARVFASIPSDPNTHASFAFWRERLADHKARIVVASTTTTAAADEPLIPIGFFFNYPRVQEELGVEALHIWLAAVAEEARGLGIFPALLESTVASARSFGYEYVTVQTMPYRFEKMFRILQANGWEIVRWREGAGDEVRDRKMLLRLKIQL